MIPTAIVFFVISLARLATIPNFPPAISCDEAAIILNAKSVIETGRDEWGVATPLFFKSFGDYKSPIFVYSTIPFVKVLGPNLYAVRLTSAIWGLLTLVVTYLLIFKLTKNRLTALLSLLLLGFMPWHFQISHLGYEVVTLPFFITASLLFLTMFYQSRAKWSLILAALTIGLTIYTYPTARILTTFYALLTLCLLVEKPVDKIIFSGILAVTSLPLIGILVINPFAIFSRFGEISVFNQPNSILTIFGNLAKYFSPNFLFLRGSDDLWLSTGQSGQLLLMTTVPLLIGIAILIKQTRQKNLLSLFMLIGLLTFPMAAILTFDNQPHPLRSTNAIPFLAVTISLGVNYLLKKTSKKVLLAVGVILTIEVGLYLWDFKTLYPTRFKDSIDVKKIEVRGFKRTDLLKFYKN